MSKHVPMDVKIALDYLNGLTDKKKPTINIKFVTVTMNGKTFQIY